MKNYEIENIEYDYDIGGIAITVTVNGDRHVVREQVNFDEDGEIILGDHGCDCWSWVDNELVWGDCTANKEKINDVGGWDNYNAIMKEGCQRYNDKREAEQRMLELLAGEYVEREDTVGDKALETLDYLYNKTEELSENVARNGREVLWYINLNDGATVAIYIDTLEELTEEEIEEQLV